MSQTRLPHRRESATQWLLRQDLRRAVMQRCPGDCAGDGMSGWWTILQRRMPDKSPPFHVQKIHRMSECITTVAPGLEAAPQAAHGIVQPRHPDYSYTAHSLWGVGVSFRPGTTLRWGSSGGNGHMQKSG